MMLVRVGIAQYTDSPPLDIPTLIQAQRMARDVKAMMDRITGMNLNLDPTQSIAEIIPMGKAADPRLWNTNGVAFGAGSDAWWDVHEKLKTHQSFAAKDTIWFVFQHATKNDYSGIAQPTAPHYWDHDSFPDVGGIATVAWGSLVRYMNYSGKGVGARRSVFTGAHELGHALGVHHPPYGLPDHPSDYAFETIMGYGGNYALSAGYADGTGEFFNPRLALPDEILNWRRHEAFSPIPDYQTANSPGVEDFVSVRVEDLDWLVKQIEPEMLASELRARLLFGRLWSEPKG